MNKFFLTIAAMFMAAILFEQSADAAQRVLIIGDDLVVEAATEPGGYLAELRATLAEEQKDVEIVALGKRGATFADWRQFVADSYQQDQGTDAEAVSIKAEFDKGADLVVVNLGLSDVLKPSFNVYNGRDTVAYGETETLSAEISGLVTDLRKRLPNVKRVALMELPQTGTDYFANALQERVNSFVRQAATATKAETIPASYVLRAAANNARLAKDEIDVVRDALHPTQHGARLLCWSLLLCLDPERPVSETFSRASTAYRNDQPASSTLVPTLDDWENLAKRYYETKVDERLRDFSSSGFFLTAQYNMIDQNGVNAFPPRFSDAGKDDEIRVTVRCATRGIEADVPLTEDEKKDALRAGSNFSAFAPPKIENRPNIETVSSGNLHFEKFDFGLTVHLARPDREGKTTVVDYALCYKGVLSDLPAEIVLRVGGVEKKVKVERIGETCVSNATTLGPSFSGLEDFPKEKAITAVDYAAMAQIDPTSLASTPVNNALPTYRPTSFAPLALKTNDWINVPDYVVNSPYAGVYIVRFVESPREQPATLKLSVGGKTHVVERVYLNGASLFFGELDGAVPEKSETALQTTLKEGRNVLVARVDHTLWDWLVNFEFFDADGAPL